MAGTRERRRRLRMDSVTRLLPNALPMLGLCAGLTAVRYGMDGGWHVAVVLIAVASAVSAVSARGAVSGALVTAECVLPMRFT